jgi:hypothetical protein
VNRIDSEFFSGFTRNGFCHCVVGVIIQDDDSGLRVCALLGLGLWCFSLLLRGGGWGFSLWFISVAPVRGGTYFSLPAAKKSRQKKAAYTANF